MECLFLYGGQEEGSVYFNTYTTLGNGNHGNPLISQKVPSPNFVWSFVYYGFSTSLSEAYGVLLSPGFVTTNNNLSYRPKISFSKISSINSLPSYIYSSAVNQRSLGSMVNWPTSHSTWARALTVRDSLSMRRLILVTVRWISTNYRSP